MFDAKGYSPPPKIGEETICPVCKQKFKLSTDHCYLIKKDYTCSWKCFTIGVQEEEKKISNDKPTQAKNN